jgi:homoserine O-acetyltransferase/O-succinyltransferase
MSSSPSFEGDFSPGEALSLESGGVLAAPTLHYAVYGKPKGDNVIFVAHALSGSARVADWWPRLFSEGGLLAEEGLCVIGINLLGSCYGSTGPQTINPETGAAYGVNFPRVSIGDNVALQAKLLEKLGIHRLKLVMGASLGGMQALQWAVQFPERVERVISIGAAPLNAMALGLNHLQRRILKVDPKDGLAIARALAVCTYKSAELFDYRFARKPDRSGDPDRFDVAGYLDHQGEKFVERFDGDAYRALTRTMDSFDPVRGFVSAEAAFSRIQAAVTLIGISSDWLFPPQEIAAIAETMAKAGVHCEYRELLSSHGHDAFLAEPDDLAALLGPLE